MAALDPNSAKKYADNIKKADDNAKDLRSSLKDILFLERDYAKEARAAADAAFDNKIQGAETAKAFRQAADATRDVRRELEDALKGEIKKKDIQKEIVGVRQAEKALLVEQEQALDKILTSIVGQAEAQKLVSDSLGDSTKLQDIMMMFGKEMTEDQRTLLNLYTEQQIIFDEQSETLAEIERRAGNIDDAFGLAGNSASSINTALDKLGLKDFGDALGIEDAVEDTRKFAAGLTNGGDQAAGLGDKFKVAGKLVQNLGKNLTKSLGPAALLAFAIESLVTAFMDLDKLSGELAKEFGVSAAEGQKIVEAANDAAGASGDLLVSTKDVVAAQQALNKEFGTAVQFSGEFAAEFASVQERTGLSADSMGLLASNAQITGTSIKDQLQDTIATTMELNNQNGIALSTKEVQEGLAKASKSALLSAGRNTKELANQVYQAKLLGVEQSKVESIADSLLDFEGSIAKELEAELLLGKDLNLEKARQAALDNDLATVAKEIKEQVGSAADFTEMNRIEQQALAAAVGMTKEELAGALVEQEKLEAVQKAFGTEFESLSDAQKEYNRLKEEGLLTEEKQKELAEKGLLDQLESASVAEKFAGIQGKIQDLFMQIASALMPIVNILVDIVEKALKPILQALNPILDVFSTILGAILKPIADILVGVLEPIFKAFLTPINQLMDAFSEIKESLSGIFGESEGLGNIFQTIGKILGTVLLIPMRGILFTIEMITEKLQGFGEIFGGLGKIIGGDFMGGIKDVGKGLTRILISPFQAMLDVGLAVVNSLIDAVNLIPGVDIGNIEGGNIVDAVFGEEESNISNNEAAETATGGPVGLATGGIVTSPTMALIGEGGEPEAVIPLSRASSMGFGGSERTIQLLERLVTAVEKGGVVELDGSKVGTALGLVSYKTQ